MTIFKYDIGIFNKGDEIGNGEILAAAETEEAADKVAEKYIREECYLWDPRLHDKSYQWETTEVEDAEADAAVWHLNSEGQVEQTTVGALEATAAPAP